MNLKPPYYVIERDPEEPGRWRWWLRLTEYPDESTVRRCRPWGRTDTRSGARRQARRALAFEIKRQDIEDNPMRERGR